MNYKVIFSAEGIDNNAYFRSEVECYTFARMMAEQGRLIRVIAEGIDVTEGFVTIIVLNKLG